MADERLFQAWDLQAAMMTKLHNVNADHRFLIREPERFHPMQVATDPLAQRGQVRRADAHDAIYEMLKAQEEAEA